MHDDPIIPYFYQNIVAHLARNKNRKSQIIDKQAA